MTDQQTVEALRIRVAELESRASNSEEVARCTFEAVWMDAKSAEKGWGGASPMQRQFWYKAAENIAAYVLTGSSPDSGTHTSVERIISSGMSNE